jgi:decaprenylphospho-beta-D-erythro-pentofuranosid-2-ulose 2-reductase
MPTTVLILGATSDMATAIAHKFASEGYHLQLAARDTTKLAAMQSDLQIRYQVNCTLHSFDGLQFDRHASFWASLNPKPAITICVMGYMNDNDKVIVSPEETFKTIHTNYTGAVSILNIAAAEYAAQQNGIIVGISSVAGMRGRQSNYIYGSAKAGFTAYLSGLRNKMYHHKVHVVTVLPGFVYTKMTEHLNLPKLLTAQPSDVGNSVYKAVVRKKNTIYIKWFWRWIMLIITSIPETIFKKKKL